MCRRTFRDWGTIGDSVTKRMTCIPLIGCLGLEDFGGTVKTIIVIYEIYPDLSECQSSDAETT